MFAYIHTHMFACIHVCKYVSRHTVTYRDNERTWYEGMLHSPAHTFFLSLSLSSSLSISLSFSHTHKITHTHIHTHSHIHTSMASRRYTGFIGTHSHWHSLSHTHTHTIYFCLTQTRTPKHAHKKKMLVDGMDDSFAWKDWINAFWKCGYLASPKSAGSRCSQYVCVCVCARAHGCIYIYIYI